MTTEFNEFLPLWASDKTQVWIIGTREQIDSHHERVLRQADRQGPGQVYTADSSTL